MSTVQEEMSHHGENHSDLEQPVDTTVHHSHDELIVPEDSASQCVSKASTTASSMARARMRAAAKKAAIEVEEAALEQLQALEIEELKLRQKQVQLSMRTKLTIAKAEEEVYTLNDSADTEVRIQHTQHAAQSLSASDASPVPHVENLHEKVEPMSSTPTGDGVQTHLSQSLSASDIRPVPGVQKVDLETTTPTVEEGSISQLVEQNQLQQQRLLEVIQMPRAELLTFDGDPLQYWTFMRSFENSVDSTNREDSAKLVRLIQYCAGKAKKVIQCSVMQPNEGYKRAKELLKERFGNDYTISETWVNKVTEGSSIGPHDKRALRDFADDLKTCKETLMAMGYIHEVNTQRVLVKIVEKLPVYLRNRWIKQVRGIKKNKNRPPQMQDLVEFVDDAAEEANDPVYGNMSKTRDLRGEANKGVAKFPLSRSNKGSFTMMTNAKPTCDLICIMCKGNHTLFGCSEFKDRNPAERLEFAKANRLCFNCLNPGHMSNVCTLNRVCSVLGCGRKQKVSTSDKINPPWFLCSEKRGYPSRTSYNSAEWFHRNRHRL